MKIILLIILTLAISGCVNKKETALENCADDLYVNYSEKSMVSVYHDRKNLRIVGIAKTLESATTKKNEANKEHAEFSKDNHAYWAKRIPSLQKYKKAIEAENVKLIDKMIYWKKETTSLQKAIYDERYFSALKIFDKAKLKRKIKVNQYYQKYKECKKEYTEAPDAFVLRWND